MLSNVRFTRLSGDNQRTSLPRSRKSSTVTMEIPSRNVAIINPGQIDMVQRKRDPSGGRNDTRVHTACKWGGVVSWNRAGEAGFKGSLYNS